MPASHPSSRELLKQTSAHAQRALEQVRAQRDDLSVNRHIDKTDRDEGLAAMDDVQQSLADLLNDVNQSRAAEQQNQSS
jgi:hypothetical protein